MHFIRVLLNNKHFTFKKVKTLKFKTFRQRRHAFHKNFTKSKTLYLKERLKQ